MRKHHRTVIQNIWVPLLHLLSSLFVLWMAFQMSGKFLSDDALITLTFAKNILRGNGFVFNQPPAVLGTTTPLFTFAVIFLGKIFPQADLPSIAVYCSAACLAAIPWVFYFFRKDFSLDGWQTLILGWVAIASTWTFLLGMETYLFALLLILAAGLYFRGKPFLLGFVLGLLFLTRGEGALLFVLFAIAFPLKQLAQTRSITYESLKPVAFMMAGTTIPLAIWFIYSQITFGSFLPNTLSAKIAQGASGMWPLFSYRLVRQWIPRFGNQLPIGFSPYLNLWWLLLVLGIIFVLKKKRHFMVFFIWILIYAAGYSILKVAGYYWYQFPIVFVLNLYVGLGLIWIGEVVAKRIKYRAPFIALYIVFTAIVLFFWGKPLVTNLVHNAGDIRGASYTKLSEWFNENSKPDESIAFIEIGYLGFYTNNKIIDLAGLISPEFSEYIRQGDFASGFWDSKANYYVRWSDFDGLLGDIIKNPIFLATYHQVAEIPGPGSSSIIIYKSTKEQ